MAVALAAPLLLAFSQLRLLPQDQGVLLEVAGTPVDLAGRLDEYFSPSWTGFQADRGRGFSVIVDGVSD